MHLPAIIHSFDISLLKAINHHRSPFFDVLLTLLTDTAAATSIAIPALIIIYAVIKKVQPFLYKGICMGLSYTISSVIATILKHTIDRLRPFDAYPFIHQMSGGGSPSFPSGHTADAFVTATSLALLFPKKPIIYIAYAWAFIIGYSRMYLGVHYPTDVIGGATLGCIIAFAFYKLWSFKGLINPESAN